MKIAITSMGETLESNVSEKFGRAPYFIIYDTETGNFVPVNNKATSLDSGAGPEAVRQLVEQKVSVLLTGNVGGNASAALKSAGIKVITGLKEGKTVRQAIEEFKASVK